MRKSVLSLILVIALAATASAACMTAVPDRSMNLRSDGINCATIDGNTFYLLKVDSTTGAATIRFAGKEETIRAGAKTVIADGYELMLYGASGDTATLFVKKSPDVKLAPNGHESAVKSVPEAKKQLRFEPEEQPADYTPYIVGAVALIAALLVIAYVAKNQHAVDKEFRKLLKQK